MKILAFVHLRNIYRSTGAGRVAREMTEHLSRQPGAEVQILADRADHRRIVHQVGAPWTGFHYHFFESDTSSQQARWLFTGSPSAERFWPEADVVYCTAESYVPTRSARLAVTLHDAAIFENNAHSKNLSLWRQRIKWSILYSQLSRKADMFHTVSRFSAERIGHFFPSLRSRLRVVHNGVSQTFFNPVSGEGNEILTMLNPSERPFIFLPGGLHHRKNADLVIKAWPAIRDRLPGYRLVIGNHCDPRYRAAAGSLGDSVIFSGFVSDVVLRSLYSAARVVWFPSLYEGFGLPVLEAMACGSAVVTSNCSSLPEAAGDAAWLVAPKDSEAHIEALIALATNETLRREFGSRGKLRAASFTWDRSASQLNQFLSSMI